MKVCSRCKEATDNFSPKQLYYCRKCVSGSNKKYRADIQSDPELKAKYNEYRRLFYNNRAEYERARSRAKYYGNREHYLATHASRTSKRRRDVLEHYGGKCACCGELSFEFLSIDHINGGGNKQKREMGRHKMWNWLHKDRPEGFRVLCHNCNQSLGAYGYCPHGNLL